MEKLKIKTISKAIYMNGSTLGKITKLAAVNHLSLNSIIDQFIEYS